MGLLDFFRAKPSGSSSIEPSPARVSDKAPEHDADLSSKYPTAVALAQRHIKEQSAGDRWLLGETDEPEPQLEDWQMQDARHEAELGAYVHAMPHVEGLQFKTVYMRTQTALIEERTARLQASRLEKSPEAADHDRQAAALIANIERGEEVPPWVLEAFHRGYASGMAASCADENERLRVIRENLETFQAWVSSLPGEQKSIAQLVEIEASTRGMGEAARQKLKAQKQAQAPSAPLPTAHPAMPVSVTSMPTASLLNKSSFWDHQVAPIKFHAGDLGKGSGHLLASGKVRIPGGDLDFAMNVVASVEPASEESVKRVGGALGWGLAGAALFGPAGLIVGGLLGGKGKEVTFVGTLRDGKRFLASARSDVYLKFQSAAFK